MFCCMQLWESIGSRNPSKVVSDFMHHIQLDNAYIGHEVVLVKNGTRICGTGGALATAPLVQSKSYFEVKIQQGGQWSVGLATRKADLNRVRGGQEAESWCLGSDHAILHNGCELHTIAPADTSITTHPLVDATSTADASLNETATAGSTTTANLVDNSDVERLVDDTSDDASLAIVKTQPPAAQHHHSLPEALSLLPAEGDTIGVAYDHVELNFYLNGRKLDVPVLNVRGTVFPALYVDEGAVLDLITNNFNYAPPPGFDRIMIEQSLL